MRIFIARSMISKIIGLMFKRDFEDVLVIVMPFSSKLNGIHTCFMRFPIDVYFLDESGELVDKRLNVKPWNIGIYPSRPAKYVIEVKSGKKIDLEKIRKAIGI